MSRQETSVKSLVIRLGLASAAMFAFGFALVPLYDIFCEVTGIRTPIVAQDAASITEQPELSRTIRLELLANTNGGAPSPQPPGTPRQG